MKSNLAKFICTFGGVGLIPTAPGTAGSLATTLFCFLAIPTSLALAGWASLLLACFASVLGVWAIPYYSPKELDHKSIVIDEVAGLALCYSLSFFFLSFAQINPSTPEYGMFLNTGFGHWIAFIAGLVFFRVFDIWKPGWVGYYDRMKSPLATVMDDLVAGIFASVPTIVTFYVVGFFF